MNYSDYFNIVLRMLSNGAEPYEIFDELSKFGDELETLKSFPRLFKSYLWGEISPSDFEKSLTDFSDFDG